MNIVTDTKQRPPAAVAAFRLALDHSHGWAAVLVDSFGGREDWYAGADAAESALAAAGLGPAVAAFEAAEAEWQADGGDGLSHPGLAPDLSHVTGSGRLTWGLDNRVWRFAVARPWASAGVEYDHGDVGGIEVLVALWAPDGTMTVIEVTPELVEDRHREVLTDAIAVAGRAIARPEPVDIAGLIEAVPA